MVVLGVSWLIVLVGGLSLFLVSGRAYCAGFLRGWYNTALLGLGWVSVGAFAGA